MNETPPRDPAAGVPSPALAAPPLAVAAPAPSPAAASPWDGRRVALAADGAATAQSTAAVPPPAGTALDPLPARRPTLRFAFGSPWHAIALGLGSGLPRFAPGSWGTFAGWVIFAAFDPLLTDLAWLGWIIVGLYFGAWSAQRTAQALGQADSGHIVIDEIVAFWIVLVMLPDDAAHPGWLQAAAFVLFRLFDIAKPPPIRWLDQRIDNGIGVMLDDLMAAFYTLLVIAIAWRLL